MAESMFTPMEREAIHARVAFYGPTGSGKTIQALAMACALSPDLPVAMIDTEKGSGKWYADDFRDKDGKPRVHHLALDPPFHPDRYIQAITNAEASGAYGAVVVDSLSHAWAGTGGVMELVDEARNKYSGNKWAAWNDVTPIQNRLVTSLTFADLHVVATMRSKMKYIQTEDDKGRSRIERVGLQAIQRDELEYEFGIVVNLGADHTARIEKTRYRAIADAVIPPSTPEDPTFRIRDLGEQIRAWLMDGAEPEEWTTALRPYRSKAGNNMHLAAGYWLQEHTGDKDKSRKLWDLAWLEVAGHDNHEGGPGPINRLPEVMDFLVSHLETEAVTAGEEAE